MSRMCSQGKPCISSSFALHCLSYVSMLQQTLIYVAEMLEIVFKCTFNRKSGAYILQKVNNWNFCTSGINFRFAGRLETFIAYKKVTRFHELVWLKLSFN